MSVINTLFQAMTICRTYSSTQGRLQDDGRRLLCVLERTNNYTMLFSASKTWAFRYKAALVVCCSLLLCYVKFKISARIGTFASS